MARLKFKDMFVSLLLTVSAIIGLSFVISGVTGFFPVISNNLLKIGIGVFVLLITGFFGFGVLKK